MTHNSQTRRQDIPVALYRMFGAAGDLLYVGQSAVPQNRLMQHRLMSEWVVEVATITVAWFPTRREATIAEMAAIKDEKPRHNLEHLVPRDEVQGPTGGEALDRWLTVNAISARQFAEQIGIRQDRIQRIIAQKSKPNGHLPDLIERATSGAVPKALWQRRRVDGAAAAQAGGR